jgi:hypothetical protein
LALGFSVANTGSADATTYTYYVNQGGGQSTAANGGNSGQVYAFCETGDVATGGGLIVNSFSDSDYNQVQISQSFPVESGGTAFAWAVSATNNEAAVRDGPIIGGG